MITFRSFSRFVRWYRWALLLFLIGVPPAIYGVAVRPDGLGWFVFGLTTTAAGFFALAGALDRTAPIRRRLELRRWRAEREELERLRAMPLRGWTK